MNIEDLFEARIKSAGEAVPGRALNLNLVLKRGRRERRMFVVGVAVAAVCSLAVIAVIALNLPDSFKSDRVSPGITPSPEGEGAVRCSASGMSSDPIEQPGLPPEVDETRRAIVAAAVACDYEMLERLTGPDFGFHLAHDASGEPLDLGTPAEYWEALERGVYVTGKSAKDYVRSPLAKLVAVLNAPYATLEEQIPSYEGKQIYAWPSLEPKHRSRGTFATMRDVYGNRAVRGFLRYERRGMPYFGYQTQIDIAGTWLIFFAGD